MVEPPRTLDDVRRIISRPFRGDEKELEGETAQKVPLEEKGNLLYALKERGVDCRTAGFRTLGTSLSRPFAGRTPSPVVSLPLTEARELKPMNGQPLTGTQSRQILAISSSPEVPRIHRVKARFLECSPEDVRMGDVAEILSELRRLVAAVEERDAFSDT
jgi:hypothetical protein